MKRLPFAVLASMFLALAACSGAAVLNTITPSNGYKQTKSIAYGQNSRQKIDIYTPKKNLKNGPVIVFIHGGGWNSGNKNMYKFIGDAFASQGYITAIPSYRLFPEVKYPDFVTDSAKAVAFVSRKYPKRPIILIGHSAGAYNAIMLASDANWLKRENVEVCKTVSGVIGLAGPYGALPVKEEPYLSIFPEKLVGQDAPMSHIGGDEPPMFLAIGDQDKTVSNKHSSALAAKIKAIGGEAKYKLYPGLSHVDMVKVLSRYFDGKSALKTDILAFVDAHSAPRQSYCLSR